MIGAGLAMLGVASASGQTNPVKIGMIGVGLRSGAHLTALKELQNDSQIVAMCDLQSARMEKAAAGLPSKPAMYTDYRELLKDKNVSVVSIITPGYLHHEMALAALRAGKDLLLEKPLALNYSEAADIVRESRKTGRIVCVGMQRRYSKSEAHIVRMVEEGTVGPVKYINYEDHRGDWNPNTTKVLDPKSGQKVSWRLLSWASGSSELEYSIHSLAMITSIVKSPVIRIAASGGVVHYKDRDTRDASSIVADFANGARLNYSFTCFGRGAGTKLLIIGDNGVIRRGDGKLVASTSLEKNPEPVTDVSESNDRPEVAMYREFFEDVRTRKQSPLRPEVALEPSKLAFGADLSIRENRVLTDKDFPAI